MLAFRPSSKATIEPCEEFLYDLKAGRGRPPQAAVLGRQRHAGTGEPASPFTNHQELALGRVA
jgi:hypothetical protein